MKKEGARNILNQPIYNKINELYNHNRTNRKSSIYSKILKSLKRYPLPIIEVSQIESLEGVGNTNSSIIQNVIKMIYQNCKKTEDENEDETLNITFDLKNISANNIENDITNLNESINIPENNNPVLNNDIFQEIKNKFSDQENELDNLDHIHFKEFHKTKKLSKEEIKKVRINKYSPNSIILTCIEYIRIKDNITNNRYDKSKIQEIIEFNDIFKKMIGEKIEKIKIKERLFKNLTKKNLIILNSLSIETTVLGNEISKTHYNYYFNNYEKNKKEDIEMENFEKNIKDRNMKELEKLNNVENVNNTKSIKTKKKIYNTNIFISLKDNIKIKVNEYEEKNIYFEEIDGYKVKLLIDKREKVNNKCDYTYFNDKFKDYKLDYDNCFLELGDFCWVIEVKYKCGVIETYMLDYVIERKITSDLISSIIDSRYKDQLLRIKKANYKNVMYLIEGNYNNNYNTGMILKSMIEARSYFKFNVINSNSVNDTINTIFNLTNSIKNKIDKEFKNKGYFTPLSEINEFNTKQNKLKNITVKQVFLESLKRMKIMSISSLHHLTNIFSTFNSLYLGLNSKKFPEIINNLNKLMSEDQKNKLFKIFVKEDNNENKEKINNQENNYPIQQNYQINNNPQSFEGNQNNVEFNNQNDNYEEFNNHDNYEKFIIQQNNYEEFNNIQNNEISSNVLTNNQEYNNEIYNDINVNINNFQNDLNYNNDNN